MIKKIEFKFGFLKNCEKMMIRNFNLMLSATELKKSLKESATSTGSVSTMREMGLDAFFFPEIKERTPLQAF